MKVAIIAGACLVGAVIVVLVGLGVFLYFKSTPNPKKVNIVREKCEEYKKLACSHPIPKNITSLNEWSPILGGRPATPGQFPHMAFMFIETPIPNQPGYFIINYCGGSLISEYFIMTAAHCVHGQKTEEIEFKLGSIDLRTGNDTWLKVDKVFVHEQYGPEGEKLQYDIALLKPKKKVDFNWATRPICLNTDYSSINTKHFTSAGWGSDRTNRTSNPLLQVLELETNEQVHSECASEFGTLYLEKKMICGANKDTDKSLCTGDSGGPVQIPFKDKGACANTYEQIGINSAINVDCKNDTDGLRLSVYTKVDRFTHWIVSRVWPELLK